MDINNCGKQTRVGAGWFRRLVVEGVQDAEKLKDSVMLFDFVLTSILLFFLAIFWPCQEQSSRSVHHLVLHMDIQGLSLRHLTAWPL